MTEEGTTNSSYNQRRGEIGSKENSE